MSASIAAIRERSGLWVRNGCPQPEHQYDMAPNDRADLLAMLDEVAAVLRDAVYHFNIPTNPGRPCLDARAYAETVAEWRAVLAKLEGGNDGC